jgi:DNA-binding MarR family transcriptional regulator
MKNDALDRDLWLFHVAFRQLVKIPDRLLQTYGLGRIHHRILFVIGRSGEIAVGAIAERLDISRQALHGPMRQLRQAGMIASRPSAENRTVQLVSLTKKGAALDYAINEVQRRHLRLAFTQSGQQSDEGWRKVMTAIGLRISPEKASRPRSSLKKNPSPLKP